MGLDTTHDAWSGAYSAFNHWRNEVIRTAGYEVTSDYPSDYVGLPGWDDDLTLDEVMGQWKREMSDPLIYLAWHSDCDGTIELEQARPLADRLEALVPTFDPEADLGGHVGNMKQKTERFVAGLRAAIEAGEPVEFF